MAQFVHTQAAAIVPHLMLMNACCMDTSCIIPFILIIVDFAMAKKLTQPIFIPSQQIFVIQLFKVYLSNSLKSCTGEFIYLRSITTHVCIDSL